MRQHIPAILENDRITTGEYATHVGDLHGAFIVRGPHGTELKIISSGTGPICEGWEHVSVSTPNRMPTWAEMCFVKSLFWRDDEYVVQYHPAKSEYVNYHPYCLHLWRPIAMFMPTPPPGFVGPKE